MICDEPRSDHFTTWKTVLTLGMIEYYHADLPSFAYVKIQSHISIENHESTINILCKKADKQCLKRFKYTTLPSSQDI